MQHKLGAAAITHEQGSPTLQLNRIEQLQLLQNRHVPYNRSTGD
jgi:hypothetical protein